MENCVGTSQKQKNWEFKVAKFGLTHWDALSDWYKARWRDHLAVAGHCKAEQGTAHPSSAVATAPGKFRVLSNGSETAESSCQGSL